MIDKFVLLGTEDFKGHVSQEVRLSRESGDIGRYWKVSLFGDPPSIQALKFCKPLVTAQGLTIHGTLSQLPTFAWRFLLGPTLLHYHGHGEEKGRSPVRALLVI